MVYFIDISIRQHRSWYFSSQISTDSDLHQVEIPPHKLDLKHPQNYKFQMVNVMDIFIRWHISWYCSHEFHLMLICIKQKLFQVSKIISITRLKVPNVHGIVICIRQHRSLYCSTQFLSDADLYQVEILRYMPDLKYHQVIRSKCKFHCHLHQVEQTLVLLH